MNWPRWGCFWQAMKPPMSTARRSRSTVASPHRCRMRGNRFRFSVPAIIVVPANACERRDDVLCASALADRFEFRTYLRLLAARCARGVQESPAQKQRARGKPGVRCTRGRAWCVVNTRVSHHRFTGSIRLSPRNGFNGFLRALPGDRAGLSPSPAQIAPRKLDASVEASEPHDFAVRVGAASSARRRRVHRIPPPTSVTTAKRPSCEDRMANQ
jgi:hypothetical protein